MKKLLGNLAVAFLFPAFLLFWRRVWRSPDTAIRHIQAYLGIEGLVLALRFIPDRAMIPCLRGAGAVVGERVVVHGPIYVVNFGADLSNLVIGDGVHVGSGVLLDLANPIHIESNATISMGSTLLTHQDLGNARPAGNLWERKDAPLVVGESTFLGANATLLSGANPGPRCLVACGGVVTHELANDTLVGGVPAKPISTKPSVLSRGS